MAFSELTARGIGENPFALIGDKWMLVTAGNERGYNTMTASWGGVGVLWGKDTATIVVRPQRYTRQFLEREERFSLSFFLEGRREALNLCGTKSGRDIDKAGACGLTPVFGFDTTYFAEADLVLVCRKLYRQDLEEDCFTDRELAAKWYPQKDYHRAYVGEILRTLRRD